MILVRVSLVLLIIVAAIFVVQLGFHSLMHHPDHHVPDMFDNRGGCNQGSSAEFFSPTRNTWMYVCFLSNNGKIAIWVLTGRLAVLCQESGICREITAIPPDNISKPVKYLTSVILRDGYILKSFHGELPDWLITLLTSGVQ